MENRLAQEKSPYLLQHASNPVDWYPWSDEAFARAARDDKPIFLSIGYSTCHWCHVMERESFEDEEVAGLLNDTFVCIKVDREERPDIDNIYMTVCTLMTGSGGWPLTIIMTPSKKPFFAGTYFPKETKYGRIGMLDMIPRLRDIWRSRRSEVQESTHKILSVLKEQNFSAPGALPDEKIIHEAFAGLADRYDAEHGGFGQSPKFPTPHNITFLLRYWKMTDNEQAVIMVENTLTAMRLGGIFDHLGFGFHRYSTDEKWLLPHFEKMLYDQALLATAYLEASQVRANPLFEQTAAEIFTYVLRDMTSPEGGFYSAEDADSEGVEGKFYVWTAAELKKVLTQAEVEEVERFYNIKPEGNFHDEASGSLSGANILHLSTPLPTFAEDTTGDQAPLLEKIRRELFSFRETRIHPHKDDKVLTDWNGLMIGALAMGARTISNDSWLEAANRAAGFLFSRMYKNGRLLHRFRDGDTAVDGMLCDYAYVVWGLLEIYAAGFDVAMLARAVELNQRMIELFWDENGGGFYLTPDGGEELLVRPKEIYDGALPSGNSIALHNILRLERLTGDPGHGARAKQLVEAFSDTLSRTPSGYTSFLEAFCNVLAPTTEVVIVGSPGAADVGEMLDVINKNFHPAVVTLFKDINDESGKLAAIAPFTNSLRVLENKATAYVCRNFSCESPVTDPRRLEEILRMD